MSKTQITRLSLLTIIIGGLLFRLILLTFIHNPGLNDQNHYYNLGQRLIEGDGLTIDYVWHYSRLPEDITHPIDHWMPLAGIVVATGMSLGGINPQSALLIFVISGISLPLLVYLASKQFQFSQSAAVISACFTAVLPDLVWNSLRTDTTILNMTFITGAILLLNDGLHKKRLWSFVASGVLVGLAYLTRNDSIIFLPMLITLLVVYLIRRTHIQLQTLFKSLIITIIAFLITITPWIIRNQNELGMLGTAETSRMFFMVDQRDHYAYGMDITLETMLERQTPSELFTKRLFEVGAAFKQMAISLHVLVLLIPVGFLYLLFQRDWNRILLIAPVIIWTGGIIVAYPILLPLKSQSGSFEKAFLTIMPLLLPLSALPLEHFLKRPILKWGGVITLTILMGINSYIVVQEETKFADTYYASIEKLVTRLDTLPDVTGDGEIRLMSQDPYVMSYFGYASIMTPLATREDTIELAKRYSIDYLLMPPGRPSLDNLYLGQEVDERFRKVEQITDAGERPFELYVFEDIQRD